MTAIQRQFREVEKRVRESAERAGRNPESVTLIAVSKTHSVEAIQQVYDLGHRDFGESRWQEAQPKIESLPSDIRWHFIGTLQSNKAKRIAEAFQVIHTLCTPSQLKEIAKATQPIEALIEVNIAKEVQKSGVFPEKVDELLQLVIQCEQVIFRGLMTIGPNVVTEDDMRPFFKDLARLNQAASGRWLSMGMSSDYNVAIQEGATHVRIGTAIFGSRS